MSGNLSGNLLESTILNPKTIRLAFELRQAIKPAYVLGLPYVGAGCHILGQGKYYEGLVDLRYRTIRIDRSDLLAPDEEVDAADFWAYAERLFDDPVEWEQRGWVFDGEVDTWDTEDPGNPTGVSVTAVFDADNPAALKRELRWALGLEDASS